MLDDLRSDLARARQENDPRPNWFSQNVGIFFRPTTLLVAVYRFGHAVRQSPRPVVRKILVKVASVLGRSMEWLTECVIAPDAEIGPGFVVRKAFGILIGATRIGKNFLVHGGAKIDYEVRSIGDDVIVGENALILGPIAIGNRVRISAGTIVNTDIPDDTIVIGRPRFIRSRGFAGLDLGVLRASAHDRHVRFVRRAPTPFT